MFLENHYFPKIRNELKGHEERERALNDNFREFFDLPIEDITQELVYQWRDAKKAPKDDKKALKTISINRYLSYLRAALNYAEEKEPTFKAPRLKPQKEIDSKKRKLFLTKDERARLDGALARREDRIRSERKSANQWRHERGLEPKPDIKGTFADYVKPVILLSLHTGIRRSALLSLKWGDIDIDKDPANEDKVFIVTLQAENDKTRKSYELPLSDDAVDILELWRKQSANTGPDDYIFPNPRTGESLQSLKTVWKKLIQDAGIKNFTWHGMRHDFASQLVMKGVDLNVVRHLMCHSTLTMTLIYAHLAPGSAPLQATQLLNVRTKDVLDLPQAAASE